MYTQWVAIALSVGGHERGFAVLECLVQIGHQTAKTYFSEASCFFSPAFACLSRSFVRVKILNHLRFFQKLSNFEL